MGSLIKIIMGVDLWRDLDFVFILFNIIFLFGWGSTRVEVTKDCVVCGDLLIGKFVEFMLKKEWTFFDVFDLSKLVQGEGAHQEVRTFPIF